MGKSCCAIKCTNRFNKDSDLSFHRVPKAKEKRNKWIAALHRDNLNPDTEAWVCGRHFVSGKKSDDPLHPDYVPSLFSFTSIADRTRAVTNLEKYLLSQNTSSNPSRESAAVSETRPPPSLSRESSAAAAPVKPRQSHASQSVVHIIQIQSTAVQTEETQSDVASLHEEIRSLKAERVSLRTKVHELEDELRRCALDASQFDDSKMKFFTGLPNVQTFLLLLSYASSALPAAAKPSLTPTQAVLLTLMKLRLGLSEAFLAHLFGIPQPAVMRIFRRLIHVMASKLHHLIQWPQREDVRRSLPVCFQTFFKNCVSIMDVFEVSVECSTDAKAEALTWSNNKQCKTIKFLVSFAPQGSISFVSKAWCGSVTDRDLIEHSGFLDKLLPGDWVLADRGLTSEDGPGLFCAELETPPSTQGEKQLIRKETESAPEVSHVRTYVKRPIGALRQKYKILESVQPVSVLKVEENGEVENSLINKIMVTCCALCNMCEPAVPPDEQSVSS